MPHPQRSTPADRLNRRSFLESSVAVAAAALIPGGAHAAGSDTIRIGLVGCGSRGVGAMLQAMAAAPGVSIAALGDRFADQVDAAAATLAATSGHGFATPALFHGEQAADAVIAADLDAVILASPPCFRPAEVAAAVRRGRHVYAEAPVGIDAAGVSATALAVEDGLRCGLSLASGLHSRHHGPTHEIVSAIAAGAIGHVRRASVIHHLGLSWRRSGSAAHEAALRTWVADERLSGGPFLADLVHAIDRANWALGEPMPLDATASVAAPALPPQLGGQRVPTVTIRFANGAMLEAAIVRRAGIETSVVETVTGDAGTADLRAGTLPGRMPPASRSIAGGHAACMAEFIASLRGGPRREDLAAACRTTMLAVLARSAAASSQPVSWARLWQPAAPAALA